MNQDMQTDGNRIRGVTAEQVLEQLRQPALRLAPGAAEAASEHVRMLLPRLRLLQQRQKATARRIGDILDELCTAPPESEGREHRDDQGRRLMEILSPVGTDPAGGKVTSTSAPVAKDHAFCRELELTTTMGRRVGFRRAS